MLNVLFSLLIRRYFVEANQNVNHQNNQYSQEASVPNQFQQTKNVYQNQNNQYFGTDQPIQKSQSQQTRLINLNQNNQYCSDVTQQTRHVCVQVPSAIPSGSCSRPSSCVMPPQPSVPIMPSITSSTKHSNYHPAQPPFVPIPPCAPQMHPAQTLALNSMMYPHQNFPTFPRLGPTIVSQPPSHQRAPPCQPIPTFNRYETRCRCCLNASSRCSRCNYIQLLNSIMLHFNSIKYAFFSFHLKKR